MDGRPPEDDYFVHVPALRPPVELPPSAPAPTPARGPSVGAVAGVVLSALAVAVAVVVWAVRAPAEQLAGGPAGGAVETAEVDASSSRRAPDPERDGYAVWARTEDGDPVRWNPCAPIGWVLNLEDAPPGAEVDLTRAVGEVAAATGLRFRYLGRTDERPMRQRPPYQPERYGDDTWAPILVAWSAPEDTDVPLTDRDRGVSIPVAVGRGDSDVFVSGQIVFNPERPLTSGFGDRRTSWGATILHELGHAVGLDHVDDPEQLMYTYPGAGPATFAAGDRRGLAELGRGGCLDVADPVDVEVTYVDDFDR